MKRIITLSFISALLLAMLITLAACGEGTSGGTSEPNVQVPPGETFFEVVFKAGDGTVLKTEQVKLGEAATAPEVPARDGYQFTGWDTAFDKVNCSMTVTAQYERLFAVTFADASGNAIKTVYVHAGEGAEAPEAPAREKYDFYGWDKAYDKITEDTVITAIYTERGMVTVIFVDHDGSLIKTVDVPCGTGATAPTAPEHEGYTFISWDKKFDVVNNHMTVTAVCKEAGKNLVTFVDHDGTILSYENVASGADAAKPADPKRAAHTFTGWDKAYTGITADTVVTAQYSASKSYTVTFVGYDDTVLKTATVYAGEAAIAPIPPERKGYLFTGWDQDISNITKDTTAKIEYAAIKHNVTFVTQVGTSTVVRSVSDGRRVAALAAPKRDGFTFVEWQANGEAFDFSTPITKDINLYAAYKTDGTVPKETHTSLVVTPDYLEVWLGMSLQLDIAPPMPNTGIGFLKKSGATFDFVSTEPSILTVDDMGNFETHEIGKTEVYAICTKGGSAGGYSVKAGDIIKATTIYVVEEPDYATLNRTNDDQKMVLDAATTPRINKKDFLNYPTGNYGDANIALWYHDREAAFTMLVDDNNFVATDYPKWEEMRIEYGIPVTYCVWTPRGGSYIAEGQLWRSLIEQGNDLMSHCADHTLTFDDNSCSARVWYDLYYGKKELSRATEKDIVTCIGIQGKLKNVYSPYLNIGARAGGGNPNRVDMIDYNNVISFSTMGTSAEGFLGKLFGSGSEANGWVCIHYHDINGGYTPHSTREIVEQCYDQMKPYIDSGRLWTTTFESALMYGQERDTAKLTVLEAGANVIRLDLTDGMNDLIFDFPLTVRVKVNSQWRQVRAFQNGEQIDSRVVEKDGETYLLVDAVPDRGEITVVRMSIETVKELANEISFNPTDLVGTYDAVPMTYSFVVADATAWQSATATQAGAVLPVVVKTENGETRIYVTCLVNAGIVTVKPGEE